MKLPQGLWPYRGLPKSIYVLFIGRIINCMGNFVFPFLVFFLTANIGFTESMVGVFRTASAVVSIIGSLIGGYLADRIGRKKIILIFQGLSALFIAFCPFLGNSIAVPYILMFSVLLNSAVQPANSAMMIDMTNTKNRKEALSLLYLGTNLGFSVGPLIAGYLFKNHTKILFFGDAATTLISLLLILYFVPDLKPSKDEIHESQSINNDERAEEGNVFLILLRRPYLFAFVLISIIVSFVYSQAGFGLPFQTKELFGRDGAKYYGMLMTVNGLSVIGLTTILTAVTRKVKPLLNIVISSLLYAIGFGMLFYVNSFKLLVLSTVIWTAGEILASTNKGVYIADHTPISHRGRFNSIIPIIIGSGNMLSPLILGGVIERNGVNIIWPITFYLALISAIMIFILYITENKKAKYREV